MQLFEKCMDTALKNVYFIKKRRSPTPWRPLLKDSNLFFMQKTIFKHFSRGLQGVGDLLFFIKHGFYSAVSMHFSNICMHAPHIVQSQKLCVHAQTNGKSKHFVLIFRPDQKKVREEESSPSISTI